MFVWCTSKLSYLCTPVLWLMGVFLCVWMNTCCFLSLVLVINSSTTCCSRPASRPHRTNRAPAPWNTRAHSTMAKSQSSKLNINRQVKKKWGGSWADLCPIRSWHPWWPPLRPGGQLWLWVGQVGDRVGNPPRLLGAMLIALLLRWHVPSPTHTGHHSNIIS